LIIGDWILKLWVVEYLKDIVGINHCPFTRLGKLLFLTAVKSLSSFPVTVVSSDGEFMV
jgi:hypothetical protein